MSENAPAETPADQPDQPAATSVLASVRAERAAYLWAVVYFVHSIINVLLPRTDKTTAMRETLRGYHYLVGTILLVLSIYLLIRWWKRRHVPVNPKMSGAANRWSFSLTFATAACLVITAIFGIFNAWADGHAIHFGPLPAFPSLMEPDRAIWLFAGYFHAGIGFAAVFLMLVTLLTAVYFLFRYGQGLFAGFLPGFGWFVLSSAAVTVYASVTFTSPDPGPRAVAIFFAVCAALWSLARLLKRQPGSGEVRFSGRAGLGMAAAAGLALPIAAGIYGPYALFRVSPFPSGQMVEAADGVTSHGDPQLVVEVVPETALERDVRAENFKWCGFCHTFNKGGKHLAGPNLYGIYGRRLGTVPNFTYTDGLAARGKAGEVWNDALMDEFLADPDAFAPGTSMVVSSGNVTDPERRAALINILKKETMGDAVKEVAAQ